MDHLQIVIPSKLLKEFMGSEELQSTYSDSYPESFESETSTLPYDHRGSCGSSSRGSIRSLSSIDELPGKNKFACM